MEREIKIQYNPQKEFTTESAAGHSVGLMSSDELTALLASVSKIYVDPVNGDDANDGESEAAGVWTLAEGIAKAVDGDFDAVVLMPGYHGYLAGHNLFGKKLIAQAGAKMIDLSTVGSLPAPKAGFSFDASAYVVYLNTTYLRDLLPAYDLYNIEYAADPVWFTGRPDLATPAGEANRLYYPTVLKRDLIGGEDHPRERLILFSGKVNYDDDTIEKVRSREIAVMWDIDLATKIRTAFSGIGGLTFYNDDNVYDSLQTLGGGARAISALTDGAGRVFVVVSFLARYTSPYDASVRVISTIWHEGDLQYWYDAGGLADVGIFDEGPLNYGSAVDAMPMIRRGGSTTVTTKAIQPGKKYTDSGYAFSVSRTELAEDTKYRSFCCAIYFNGVPNFSTYQGNGKCYSAQQLSDAIESGSGTYASLPDWAETIVSGEQRYLALEQGFREGGVYNAFPHFANYSKRINPNAPFLTAPRMLSTDAPASDFDPVFFDAAQASSDSLFYGGSVQNLLFFAQLPYGQYSADHPITIVDLIDGSKPTLSVPRTVQTGGIGCNTRLKNCEVYVTDMDTQKQAYADGAPVADEKPLRDLSRRAYIEAWFTTDIAVTDLEGGVTHSDKCRTIDFNRFSINRTAFDRLLKNTACVGMYMIAEHVRLWHVSATVCVYATIDETLMHGCCFSYFTGYYLTPDASPITAAYCWIKEALASNLIPPDSTVTNSQSGDPLFRNTGSPYDLRLQALAKDDFFDSPAIGFTPEISAFGGAREAGAYDEKATVNVTWSEFLIVFPWMMPTGIDRLRLENRRQDGQKTKLSVSAGTFGLQLGWSYALSEDDLRNIEALMASSSSQIRVFFNPVSKPTKFLEGYLSHTVKNGGPFGLMPNLSDKVQLDFDAKMPVDSVYEYL